MIRSPGVPGERECTRDPGQKFAFITFLYAFGILLVVAGHSLAPMYRDDSSPLQNALSSWIYSFHMPLFFFLSGFVSHVKPRRFGDFAKKRAVRLLIPYVVVNSVYAVPKVLLARYAIEPLSLDNALGFLLFPRSSTVIVLWFLPVMFAINCLGFWAYESTRARSPWWKIILLAGFGAANAVQLFGDSDLLGASLVARFAFFYWLGHVAFASRDRVLAVIQRWPWAAAIILFGGHLGAWKLGAPATFVACLGIGFSVSLAMMVPSTGAVLGWLSRRSYQIYLLSAFGHAPARILLRQSLGCGVGATAIGMFVGGLVVPAILVAVIARWAPRAGLLVGMDPAPSPKTLGGAVAG